MTQTSIPQLPAQPSVRLRKTPHLARNTEDWMKPQWGIQQSISFASLQKCLRVIGKQHLTEFMPGSVQGNQVKNNEISAFGAVQQSKLPQTLGQMTPKCPYRFISNSAGARTRRKLGDLLETSQSKTNQRLGRHCQKTAFTSQESWSRSCLTCPLFVHIRWFHKWTY